MAKSLGLWVCGLAATASFVTGPGLGAITRAQDVGPINVSKSRGASTVPAACQDSRGRIHLAWADNPGSDDVTQQFLYYARSTDGGATFEDPRALPTTGDAGRKPREIRVVTEGDTVAIAWWDPVVGEDGRVIVTAFFIRSSDGGATFTPAIATSLMYRDDAAAKEGFRNTTSLSLAAGADGTFVLLASIPDVFRGFNIYFARSADGSSFGDPVKISNYTLAIPRAASNGVTFLPSGTIYATWSESVGDFVNEIKDVLYATSTDGGRTFSTPTKIAHVRGVVGAVHVAGNALAIVTQSQKNDHTLAITKLFRSSDGGKTFGARVRVARPGGNSHLHENSIAANDTGVVAIAWSENSSRLGSADGIYVSVSHDGGKHFDEPRLLVAGLFIDPPSVTVDASGRIGVALSSSDATLEDREVLFVRVAM